LGSISPHVLTWLLRFLPRFQNQHFTLLRLLPAIKSRASKPPGSTIDQRAAKTIVSADAPADEVAATDALFAAGMLVVNNNDTDSSLELLSDSDPRASEAIDDFFGE